jgi:hypothetical protein
MRTLRLAVAVLMVASVMAVPAVSAPITVPNHSFESPAVPNTFPYVSLGIDEWQRMPVPEYWTNWGYSSTDWNNTVGLFLNVPFDGNGNPADPIDNVDGQQAVFMFPWPGQGLWQILDATFEVGQSYRLTALVQGGGTMPLGVPMEIRLFFLDGKGDDVKVGAQEVLNINPPNTKIVHFPEYHLDIPTVQAGDAWAGKPIGVELISTSGLEVFDTFGYQQWEFDNIRLTAAPEPASVALLAAGLGAVLARRRSDRR